MAKKITELPTLSSADNDDLIPIVDISGAVTKKVTASGLGAAAIAGAPNGSIVTQKLADGAITSNKIDFVSFPGVAFYGNANSNTITVTPAFNGLIDIQFSMLCWGSSGALYTAKINTPAGLTAVSDGQGGVEGGNTVNKMLVIKSLFSGAQKGVAYTFNLTNVSGTPGGTNDRRFAVKVYQQGVV